MRKYETNIPIPPAAKGRKKFYHFDRIQVGQSTFIRNRTAHQVNSAYQQYKKRHPKYKLVIRTEDHGCRIWRVRPLKPLKTK